jgi:hypothetical protein
VHKEQGGAYSGAVKLGSIFAFSGVVASNFRTGVKTFIEEVLVKIGENLIYQSTRLMQT